MKISTLPDHDRALAQLIIQQTAATTAIGTRIGNAGRIVAAFTAAPTEAALAATISAQLELDALAKIQDALPDPDRREAALRDDYARKNRDDLLKLLESDFAARLKNRSAWRGIRASEIAKLSEVLALREASPEVLTAASNRVTALDGELANADATEREARRNTAVFVNDPSFTNLTNARSSLSSISF